MDRPGTDVSKFVYGRAVEVIRKRTGLAGRSEHRAVNDWEARWNEAEYI